MKGWSPKECYTLEIEGMEGLGMILVREGGESRERAERVCCAFREKSELSVCV